MSTPTTTGRPTVLGTRPTTTHSVAHLPDPADLAIAAARIAPHIVRTPCCPARGPPPAARTCC